MGIEDLVVRKGDHNYKNIIHQKIKQILCNSRNTITTYLFVE